MKVFGSNVFLGGFIKIETPLLSNQLMDGHLSALVRSPFFSRSDAWQELVS